MQDAEVFLSQIEPFKNLPQEEIRRVVYNLCVRYYRASEEIFRKGSTPTEHLLILRKGALVVEENDQILQLLHEGDVFVLPSKPLDFSVKAKEDSVVFFLQKGIFLNLLQKYSSFVEYFTEEVSKKIQRALPKVDPSIDKLFSIRVTDLNYEKPILVDKDTDIGQVLKFVAQSELGSVIVDLKGQYGIITDRDLIKLLAKEPEAKRLTAKDVCSTPLIGVNKEASLFQAILLMAKHGIRRVAIYDNDKPIGLLDDRSIITYQTKNIISLTQQIDKAKTLEDLRYAYTLARESYVDFIMRGIDPQMLGLYISEINDRIMKRTVLITIQEMEVEPLVPYSIMVLGSEGRREQNLGTDQDNALVYLEEPLLDVDIKRYFEEFSRLYIKNLLSVGFPECPGKVMLSYPDWRKNFNEWTKAITSWIEKPEEKNMINLSILLDARSVFGDQIIVERLKNTIFQRVEEFPRVLSFLSLSAVKFKPPLGFLGSLVVEKSGDHRGELDLKKGGIFPIMHGVRVLSLEYKVEDLNTFDRINRLQEKGVLSKDMARDLTESYRFLLSLRFRSQARKVLMGKNPDNYVNPDELSKVEKSLLKEIFRTVERFQDFIREHYKLAYYQ
ncbi:putative nucleotidyltransferase substrate binding domain-containing protein [Thermocrinis minervae]|uniref:CBS domain-containing protein n=1 Tax=Thermocrinis minervae TaxID=381751 RepID=A0A1M6QCC4_9AQUI|nr:putative nucleotidyltransferase substrate binding domain-containing protein [Thermocrinis minervae]SHK17831.1 CBS domain-containing protein [Thermocrinis minervae]